MNVSPETRFAIDAGIEITLRYPSPDRLPALPKKKIVFSFFIRKVLARAASLRGPNDSDS